MWCPENTMTNYPYILFNKSPEQLRRLGARGGRAYGRNQRVRRAQMPTPPAAGALPAAHGENAAEAIAVLDAQFPWLRGAESDSQEPASTSEPAAPRRRIASSDLVRPAARPFGEISFDQGVQTPAELPRHLAVELHHERSGAPGCAPVRRDLLRPRPGDAHRIAPTAHSLKG
jgi:hypothetical protein